MSDCCTFAGGFGGAVPSGGGGDGGVIVEDEGVPISDQPSDTLDFEGDGVTAADAGDGVATITIPGNVYSPPEAWILTDIRGDTDEAMLALVSANFTAIKMIRAGSIVGLGTRLTETITAGSCTVEVTINGVLTGFKIEHTDAANQDGGEATEAVGLTPYAAGDLIGLHLTTNAGFAPDTTDLEAWVQLFESP